MEEQNENVVEEVQQEEVVQSQENHNSIDSHQFENEISDKEKNFLRLRETKEQLERENRELKEAIQRSAQVQKKDDTEEDEFSLDDDDLVEGKVVKKMYQELKSLKKTYEQSKNSEIPDRLRNKFSDFDQVVCKENIEKLKNSEPELYASITSGNDLYSKGVSAYKTLKALGYIPEDYSEAKKQVQKNAQKPQSVQAIKGQGALSDANIFAKGLTPDLKNQLLEEMEQAIRAR